MADVSFDTYLDHLGDGFTWATATLEAALFVADTWTPDPSDVFVLSATGAGATECAAPNYARVPLVSPVKNLDGGTHRVLFSSNVIDFGSLDTGYDFDTLVIYVFVTDDTDSWMVCSRDIGAQTTDGSAQRFVPDGDGLFALQFA